MRIILLSLFAFFTFSCANSNENFNFGKFVEDFTGIYMTDEVTPENEEEFKMVPFEKVINPTFQKNLTGRLRFVARYKGTAPNAKVRVSDHVTLKLCDPTRNNVCSERIIIPEKKSEIIFSFSENTKVDVFGTITETSGTKVGGTTVDHSQLGGIGGITFFKVWSIRKSDGSYKNKRIQSNTNQDKTVYNIQKKLAELGYNPGPADGIMGGKTRKAIKLFQQDNDLTVDGLPTESLLSILKESKPKKVTNKLSEQISKTNRDIKSSDSNDQIILNDISNDPISDESSEILPEKTEEQQPAEAPAKKILLVSTKGKIKIFSKPNPIASVIGSISPGKKIDFIEVVGNFYRINYKGKDGYIHNSFCTVNN